MPPATSRSPTPEQRFAALVTPHFDALYRIALRLTRQRPDAEDLVQDVCVRAFGRLAELEHAAEPRAWLVQVQYRLFVDGARRRKRAPFAPLPDDDSFDQESGAPSPEQTTDAELEHVRLAACWKRLDADQRALLALHAEGYTLAELESACGLSKNALSARLHRARARLAKLMRREIERCPPPAMEHTQ